MLGLTVACARCHDHKFDPISMRDYYALAGVFASTRMVNQRPDGTIEKNEAQSTNMSLATLHVVRDSDKPEDLPVFLRGNVERKGAVAERRFLRVLSRGEPEPFHEGSGRGELARAISDPANPLTARVMVNRVWGQFLGQPLVASPSNFGHSGQPPSYPELLDDLAVRFMADGWSIKTLVRELVLSATYRQTALAQRSKGSPDQVKGGSKSPLADADESAPLGHMNRRRLSVEQWRDAVLFVSGELDFASAGPSQELDELSNHRRTVYARVSRLKLNDLLMQFDYPDANVHAEKRSSTTTATQKLFVLNSPFMLKRAKALAARVHASAADTDEARVGFAYRLCSRASLRLRTGARFGIPEKPARAMSRAGSNTRNCCWPRTKCFMWTNLSNSAARGWRRLPPQPASDAQPDGDRLWHGWAGGIARTASGDGRERRRRAASSAARQTGHLPLHERRPLARRYF
jgi:hypothetical protein